jgi:thiol-disulfide isomerase/thioredoxin
MVGNLTGKQILLIILAIIIVLWGINYYMNYNLVKKVTDLFYKPTAVPAKVPIQQRQIVQKEKSSVPSSQTEEQVPFTLYIFYSPQCGYCKSFFPVARQVAGHLQERKDIVVRFIDATKPENENIAFYYNINAYPTIILVTPNRNIEYAGNRTVQDFYQFIVGHMNDYYEKN